MGEGNWLSRGIRRKNGSKKARGKSRLNRAAAASQRSTLDFEALEDRRMLATFLVTNTLDKDGDTTILGSLRWAIESANADAALDFIVFSENIFENMGLTPLAVESAIENDEATYSRGLPPAHAIVLNGGELSITERVRILGPGARQIVIHQDTVEASRVFNISIGPDDEFFEVEISGVTIEDGIVVGTGDDRKGAGVYNREALTMNEVRVRSNSASRGGGGVYTEFGFTDIVRSEFYDNSGGGGGDNDDDDGGGGGILNGASGSDPDNLPSTFVTNSTIHSNSGFQGSGVMNRNGRLFVYNSTITNNFNGGIGSYGNPRDDEPATIFTRVGSNIIWENLSYDIAKLGFTDDDPVLPLLRSIESDGFNIYGYHDSLNNPLAVGPDGMVIMIEDPDSMLDPKPLITLDNDQFLDYSDPMMQPMDFVDVDPLLQDLGDYGGPLDTYVLDPTSPAIDMGNNFGFGGIFGGFGDLLDARGRQFTREFDYTGTGMATSDIGAVEMQAGIFVVDTLVDEFDYSYNELYVLEFIAGTPIFTMFPNGPYGDAGNPAPVLGQPYPGVRLGDLSFREALAFAEKNPGPDTIQFSQVLNELDALERQDPDVSAAPTIILNRAKTLVPAFPGFPGTGQHLPLEGPLAIGHVPARPMTFAMFPGEGYVDIEGPQGFILEIDASGNDLNTNLQTGGGSRVMVVDDFDATRQIPVSISNLTIMGADTPGDGGGIFNREDLSLSHVTFKNNNALDDGGALFVFSGTVTIDASTFNNNRAADNGAGINVSNGATVNISNSTFSANNANNRGGAIYNEGSNVLVEFSTITLNKAGSTRGSGILNINSGALTATTSVRSSIISDNDNDADVDFLPTATPSSFVSLGYNFIGLGSARTAFNAPGDQAARTNPMLQPLLNTGGLVATHRPNLGSPVIDAGDPAAVPGMGGVPDKDQRGGDFLRIVDGNGDGNAQIDIGSYELQRILITVSNPIDENDGVLTVGELSLREAIVLANLNPFFDEITFDSMMIAALADFQQNDPKIFLGSSPLVPGTATDLRITGSVRIFLQPGDMLAIDGQGLDHPSLSIQGSRMFTIDDGDPLNHIDVTIEGLEIRNARSPVAGGAIWSSENLTLDHVMLVNNYTLEDPTNLVTGLHGGAIYQQGVQGAANPPTLTIQNDSTLTSNQTRDMDADGGAIYATDANVIISFTTIAGNSTNAINSQGGGIYLRRSTLNADLFTSITGNSTATGQSDGGGFFAESSVVTLQDVALAGNNTAGSNSKGAGFASLNSQITLNDTIVSENDTTGTGSHGGGIFATGGTLTLNRSMVQDNTTAGGFSNAGGIGLNGGTAVLDATTVRTNRVTGESGLAGGIWNNGGVLTVRGSTIATNEVVHALGKGGGIYSDTNLAGSQSTLVLNSTISGNSAPLRGGGIFNADGRTDIKHSTITNNSTASVNTGAGVASFGNSATTLTTVLSSIIAGNAGSSRTDVDSVDASFNNTFQSLGNNVIGNGNALSAFNPNTEETNELNPGLAPLADNGAPSNVSFTLQTHALLDGSPAINAGSASFNPNAFSPPLTTDQRGAARTFGRIDAGAVESTLAPAIQSDFDSDGDVDGRDFLTWQRNLGQTSATKAQGDANGDAVVNGQDLTVWRGDFGAGPAGIAAAAASTSGTPFISEAVQAASSADGNDSSRSANELSSLAWWAASGDSAALAKTNKSLTTEDPISLADNAEEPVAASAVSSTSRFSLLSDLGDGELDSLLAEERGDTAAAEDEVFAAWGEPLLF